MVDETLKQRLVGAVVIVALGVIFIPALLDSNGENQPLTVKMEIPDKPDINIERHLETLNEEEAAPELPPPPEKSVSQNNMIEQDASQTLTPRTSETLPPAQSTSNSQVTTPQWVVQVGSFGQEDNASKLTAKLKQAGWQAFIEQGRGAAGPVFRVRIGPVTDKKTAEQLMQKAIQQGYRPAIVLSYP